jgi:hypothetical protein
MKTIAILHIWETLVIGLKKKQSKHGIGGIMTKIDEMVEEFIKKWGLGYSTLNKGFLPDLVGY